MDFHRVGFSAALSFALSLILLARGANATTVLVLHTLIATYVGVDSQISRPDGSYKQPPACKIHITEDNVWASAGPLLETQGPFDLRVYAYGALRGGTPFGQAVTSLSEQVGREYPDFRSRVLQSGVPALNANLDIVVVSVRDPTYASFIRFSDNPTQRLNCPDGCASIWTQSLGFTGAIDKILDHRPAIWKEMGILKAMRYLIAAQERATPHFVSGPIAVLEIKPGEARWLSRGACGG